MFGSRHGCKNDRRHLPWRPARRRPDPDMGAMRPGRRMGQRLDRAGLRMGADMKIRESAYYRTRDGDVVGPMRRTTDQSWYSNYRTWNEDGGIFSSGAAHDLDLVAEVYVSDTPPAPQVNTTKTARDELVEKAALAILTGRNANSGPTFKYGNKGIWSEAEEFVEARKK